MRNRPAGRSSSGGAPGLMMQPREDSKMNDMTATVTPEERAQWLKDAQPKRVEHYEPIDFELDKRIRRLIIVLETEEAESTRLREQVSALLVLNETGMDLMDACMAEAEAISAHDDAKTGRTLETKTRLENVQACIMAAYGKARKAQEKCEALGLNVTPSPSR